MSHHNSNTSAKRFIAAEYEGRQVAVRRSANYDITLTLVKEAFRSLNTVDAERISISAFVEELGDNLEISKNIWPDLLPELQRITVTLDSSSPESDDSDYASPDEEDDSSTEDDSEDDDSEGGNSGDDMVIATTSADQALEPRSSQSPAPRRDREPISMTHRRLVEPCPSRWSTTLTRPKSLPPQDNFSRANTGDSHLVRAFYFHNNRSQYTSVAIATQPTTTIVDLQEFIALRCPYRGFIVAYHLFGQPFDHLKYVRDMKCDSGPKFVQVHMVDRDPGQCRMGQDGHPCDLCYEATTDSDSE
ncbi:hypothetical protein FRC12_022937 [Ceratobasidium sp. 428]|nr:hypothetical protein FRC12_022937 [Ceratobasidium sp. 428]